MYADSFSVIYYHPFKIYHHLLQIAVVLSALLCIHSCTEHKSYKFNAMCIPSTIKFLYWICLRTGTAYRAVCLPLHLVQEHVTTLCFQALK
jgi:hypothetical protein